MDGPAMFVITEFDYTTLGFTLVTVSRLTSNLIVGYFPTNISIEALLLTTLKSTATGHLTRSKILKIWSIFTIRILLHSLYLYIRIIILIVSSEIFFPCLFCFVTVEDVVLFFHSLSRFLSLHLSSLNLERSYGIEKESLEKEMWQLCDDN